MLPDDKKFLPDVRSLIPDVKSLIPDAKSTGRVRDFADEQHAVVLRSETIQALAKGVKTKVFLDLSM